MPAFAPSRTPDHGYPLLRWFSLVSLLALGAASVVSAVLMSRFLEAQLLRHDAELSRDFVQSIVSTQAVEDAFRAAPGKDPPAAFAEFLKHVAAMPDVLRTNVYGMDRRMLWSSDPALIGQRFEHNEELDRALAGELAIERGTVSGAEPLAKPERCGRRRARCPRPPPAACGPARAAVRRWSGSRRADCGCCGRWPPRSRRSPPAPRSRPGARAARASARWRAAPGAEPPWVRATDLRLAGAAPAAPGARPFDDVQDLNLERAERRLVETALARTADNVTAAARLLGVSRDTLRYRLERLGLRGDTAGPR